MPSTSRVERLNALLASTENLPAKIQKSEPQLEPAPTTDTKCLPCPNAADEDVFKWQQVGTGLESVPYHSQISQASDQSQKLLSHAHAPKVEFDRSKGECAALGLSFSPFLAVTKYCYKFVPKQFSQRIATAFFDANKIYDKRSWDLYYIASDYCGVQIFVTEGQLRELIREINSAFATDLNISSEYREEGLVVDFDDLPYRFRPRWLGHCTSRAQYQAWISRLVSEPMMIIPDDPHDKTLEAFKRQMDVCASAAKTRSNAAKQKKQESTLRRRQNMAQQILRVQRHVGFLSKHDLTITLPDISGLSMTDSPEIDPNRPPPYVFDKDVIFIAIDVEANERIASQITEVGVATLDTRDLKGVAPGKSCENWKHFIRGRHFRIAEYKNHVNHEFVRGCPGNFEFGQSELVSRASMPQVLAACFREPVNEFPGTKVARSPPLGNNAPVASQTRNLIVVGHDLDNDIAYCRKLGFEIFNRSNIIDTVDTARMFQAYTQDPNPSSLAKILVRFDILGWFLHNAGNDAVYTLQALLAMSVASAVEREEEAKKRNQDDLEQRRNAHVARAAEKAEEEGRGRAGTEDWNGRISFT